MITLSFPKNQQFLNAFISTQIPLFYVFVVDLQYGTQSQFLSCMQANTRGIIWAAPLPFAAYGLCHFPAKKRKSSRKLIVPLQSFQGQQVKGLAIMERRISESFKIWPVIYHYP